MSRLWKLAFAVLVALLAFVVPRTSWADPPGAHTVSVAVLTLDSEDAEDQADALTGALRSRIRNAPGWSLVDSTQSLGMLTAALRCPARPPPDCQTKIAEQIKVDRYIWGFVQKAGAGQVTAEVHFYQKGKADTLIRESYADNLKDPQDDKGLGKIAQRVLDRLGGSAMGTVVVKAGDLAGEVIVDGEKHVPLANGTAKIELGAGGHSIEIASPGGPTTKRNVLVTAGRETVLDIAEQTAPPPVGPDQSKPFPVKKILAGVAVVGGIVLEVVTVIEYGKYKDALDKGETERIDAVDSQNRPEAPCQSDAHPGFCNADKDAKSASRTAIITGIGGGVLIIGGVFLYLWDSGSSEKSAMTHDVPKPQKPRLVPSVGTNSGALFLTGSF